MKVHELVARLLCHDQEKDIMITEVCNAVPGHPRIINFGPVQKQITKEAAEDTTDCADKIGQDIVLIGFGCY